MEIIKKLNPNFEEAKKEIDEASDASLNKAAANDHPVEKEKPDEVIIPRKDGIDTNEIPDEVEIPRKDNIDSAEIPDEVEIPRKDDNDTSAIPDEVVIPRKETDTETL